MVPQWHKQRLDLGLALEQPLGEAVIHRQGLRQHEQMLIAPIAGERTLDFGRDWP